MLYVKSSSLGVPGPIRGGNGDPCESLCYQAQSKQVHVPCSVASPCPGI